MEMHQWRIEPREYERHERRRGRRHAFERLDPARTALVVVDMVPFFLDENIYARSIVPNIAHLAESARTTGATVAWVLPAYEAPFAVRIEFFGESVAVADANAAVRDEDLNATLHTFYRSFGDVRTTAEVIGLLTTG